MLRRWKEDWAESKDQLAPVPLDRQQCVMYRHRRAVPVMVRIASKPSRRGDIAHIRFRVRSMRIGFPRGPMSSSVMRVLFVLGGMLSYPAGDRVDYYRLVRRLAAGTENKDGDQR
jgi:hypothetical protein